MADAGSDIEDCAVAEDEVEGAEEGASSGGGGDDDLEMDEATLESLLQQVRDTLATVNADAKDMQEAVDTQRKLIEATAEGGNPQRANKLSKCRVAGMKAAAKKSEAVALQEEVKLLESQLEAVKVHNQPDNVKAREAEARAIELKAQIASAENELKKINDDAEHASLKDMSLHPRDRVKHVSIRIMLRFLAKGYANVCIEQWRANKDKYSKATWMPAYAAHSRLEGACQTH